MFKIKLFFARIWCYLFVRSGVYYAYSRLIRRWVERRHCTGLPRLAEYAEFLDVTNVVARLGWGKDTWWEGWDTFSYPSKVQHDINTGVKDTNDCDDISLYLANVLPALEAKGKLFGNRKCKNFRVLTVVYADKATKRIGGHNVCIFETYALGDSDGITLQYGHVSNWENARVFTGRYDGSYLATVGDVVEDVISKVYTGGINIAWAMCDKDCRYTGDSGKL